MESRQTMQEAVEVDGHRQRAGALNLQISTSPLIVCARALCMVLCVLLCAPTRADATAEPSARHHRIQSALQRSLTAYHGRDIATCKALLQEMLLDFQAEWSRDVFWLWSSLSACDTRPGGPWEHGVPSADLVVAGYQRALDHFAAMPRAQRVQDDHWVGMNYRMWAVLRSIGQVAAADELEEALVGGLIRQVQADPGDELALAGLRSLAAELYGAQWRMPYLAQLQQRLAQALGPGHAITLQVLRDRIFSLRLLQRPQEALALSDEYAALAQQHQPGNERLVMLNRSERVGAFAGVGRYADARDEGLALLHYMQAQQPRPYANLMRSAYNLAGLYIDMADYDGAVHYAQMSIDEGSQTPSYTDRQQVDWARLLLTQARALRGDAGALQAFHAEMASVLSHSVGTVGPLHSLWRAAQDAGVPDIQTWSRQLMGRVVSENSIALQGIRAFPRVMDAAALPAGNAEGLQLAAEATAYALASNDDGTQVLAQFALARQVAPLRPEAATWAYKRAALGLLKWRQSVPSGNDAEQRALLAGHEAELRAFIGLLIDQGRLTEAEQAIGVLREEELYEFRRRSRGAPMRAAQASGLSFTADEQRRNERLVPVQQALQDEATQARLRAEKFTRWVDRVKAPDPQADAALLVGTQAVQAVLSESAPASRGVGVAQPLQARRLAPQHARLAFVVRPHAVDVMVQRGQRLHHVALRLTATELNRAVQALRAELRQPGLAVPPAALQLHRWLVAPLAPLLQGVRHLQWVPDGALRYVPFAALHDGRQYLAQRYSMSIEPGGAAPAEVAAAQPAARGRLVAFGRTLPDAQHSALPGVQQELAMLRSRGAQVVQDTAFTAAALSQALAQQPQVVHLASHFVLDAAGEESSYLLLGDGQRLSLRQLREMPWRGVRLALLSACDSALAVPTTDAATGSGREWAGFASALHAAGVANVMATLWRIDDNGAAQWMRHFYAQRASGPGPARALSAEQLALAQRRWLTQHQGTPKAHPHYWAAFQWMGSH